MVRANFAEELVPPGRFDGLWDAQVRGIVYRQAA
jgi:hypothetical protein